ncbi:TPA: integrase domain-containing protein [Stenotrophomonas maltophilia]|nr:integrase domain-containing protein [Stenotrophomonas maltophilia]HDS1025426.1 integrase domain-containing protein [Stenotrophomonas maltophilia]HDS1028163.1 integrase domain-containing protein [Stenotrophomonas maltophilia]HDS1029676.1 integrase domain-containing protein [Stenotrophomonas maltophilia]HDS1033914.1 integrase domain-containing protein [Stenotrophomonas maltophilia]
MDDLTYTLRQLCQRNRDGSHNAHADRMRSLSLAARQLREASFRQMKASSLKGKQVQALLDRWQSEGLSSGTIKNRLSHLRWWAEKISKSGILPADNMQFGVAERRYVTNVSKAQELGTGQVTDSHVRMSLQLQAAFGLRREEAIKFQPCYADRGDHITLKGSWKKGGRERTVLISATEQRDALRAAHHLAGTGSLIPTNKTYIQQRHVYDGQCKAAGLSHMHGLRHQYAQSRYETLTGWSAPSAGGPPVRTLSDTQRTQDTAARQIISRELGHERLQVTSIYFGK